MSLAQITEPDYINKNITLYVNGINTQVAPVMAATIATVTTTISAANVAGYLIKLSASGNVQLPTAAALVAQFPDIKVDQCIGCLVVNQTGGSCSLTTNTGLTLSVAKPVATLTSRMVYFQFTNITASSEAAQVL